MTWPGRREAREQREKLSGLQEALQKLELAHSKHREEAAQARAETLETVQQGVAGLCGENRELRRRQERMLSDLNGAKDEMRALRLELAQALLQASSAGSATDVTGHGAEPDEDLVPESEAELSAGEETDQGEGTMTDESARTEGTAAGRGPEVSAVGGAELKRAIECAYRGEGGSTATTPAGRASMGWQHPPSGRAATDACGPPEHEQCGPVAHGVLLLKAAGAASVELVLHRDTWEFVLGRAVGHDHFRLPPDMTDLGNGRVRVALSGRSLIAVLIQLWQTRSEADPLQADWTLAVAVYCRIAERLSGVVPSGRPITIVLDDGVEDAEGQGRTDHDGDDGTSRPPGQ
ncbi:hypothetical protein [Streptomyces nodosus]|uniref:hypothetical protein n=1 Tax=Streptomyces nodosus TaxID=40318 RepID=UPI003823EE7B